MNEKHTKNAKTRATNRIFFGSNFSFRSNTIGNYQIWCLIEYWVFYKTLNHQFQSVNKTILSHNLNEDCTATEYELQLRNWTEFLFVFPVQTIKIFICRMYGYPLGFISLVELAFCSLPSSEKKMYIKKIFYFQTRFNDNKFDCGSK